MSDKKYNIFYVDLKNGVAAEDTIEKLAKLPKFSHEKAEKIIRSKNRAIKAGLNKKESNIYRSYLDKIGLCVEIHEETEKTNSDLPVQETIKSTKVHDNPKKVIDTIPKQGTGNNVADDNDRHRTIQVKFNGQAFEYFKIWIVNIFLSIITLGIYSAWAKVRNNQYFYGNTIIDGSSFNYTAKPISILKGRLIAVGILGVYSIVNQVSPMAGFALSLAFMPVIPWLITRSLAFNARNSMYRNIRLILKVVMEKPLVYFFYGRYLSFLLQD